MGAAVHTDIHCGTVGPWEEKEKFFIHLSLFFSFFLSTNTMLSGKGLHEECHGSHCYTDLF
jgi:hypothetical protein